MTVISATNGWLGLPSSQTWGGAGANGRGGSSAGLARAPGRGCSGFARTFIETARPRAGARRGASARRADGTSAHALVNQRIDQILILLVKWHVIAAGRPGAAALEVLASPWRRGFPLSTERARS